MKKSPYLELEEVKFLINYGETKSLVYISKTMGRSWNFVKKCLGRLGIKNCYDNSKKWIPNEDEIQVMRSGREYKDISITLNKSVPTILKNMRILSIIEPKSKRAFKDHSKPVPKILPPSIPREISAEDRIKQSLIRIGL